MCLLNLSKIYVNVKNLNKVQLLDETIEFLYSRDLSYLFYNVWVCPKSINFIAKLVQWKITIDCYKHYSILHYNLYASSNLYVHNLVMYYITIFAFKWEVKSLSLYNIIMFYIQKEHEIAISHYITKNKEEIMLLEPLTEFIFKKKHIVV